VDVVELEVLARRDVRDRVGVFFRKLGQNLKLFRVQSAERDLDALHAGRIPQHTTGALRVGRGKANPASLDTVMALPVVITLAVGAST
jgi:hypothetical protein